MTRPAGDGQQHQTLKLRRLGIDTYTDPVIFMNRDCPIFRSEGFEARARVKVALGQREIIATLHVVSDALLAVDEAGLSEFPWRALGASEGAQVRVSHPQPVESVSRLRAKVYGARLGAADMEAIIRDVVGGVYSDLHLAAFVTATAGDRLDVAETIALTQAMLGAGERIRWDYPIVADKHSVGGLPGNRTTPLVVAMVAACGVPIPKTSSRAITSPAGTADTMEVLAPVDLDVAAMRRVVAREGGCIVWGGAGRLSPADDVLIRVERPLDFDSDGQLVASVLSKKAAAGSTHVVIDMPVGPTAKVRSAQAAESLSGRLRAVGAALGLQFESYVRFTQPFQGDNLAIVCSLNNPDAKALALLFAARTARELGAASVGLVAPYLGYMRQDQRFHHGEAVTSVHFAALISAAFDWLVTVDPHLHRRGSLSEIYSIPNTVVAAAPAMARWIAGNVSRPLIVGPDSESEQWAAEVAAACSAPHVVMSKTRLGDRRVEIQAPPLSQWKDRRPVLLDDIIASASTMALAAKKIQEAGLDAPVCVGVHGVFSADALGVLRDAGAARIVTTNTIAHETNAIDVSSLVARGIESVQKKIRNATRIR